MEDVRETEIDKIEINKCFRPGDVVRAEVVFIENEKEERKRKKKRFYIFLLYFLFVWTFL